MLAAFVNGDEEVAVVVVRDTLEVLEEFPSMKVGFCA